MSDPYGRSILLHSAGAGYAELAAGVRGLWILGGYADAVWGQMNV